MGLGLSVVSLFVLAMSFSWVFILLIPILLLPSVVVVGIGFLIFNKRLLPFAGVYPLRLKGQIEPPVINIDTAVS